MTTFLKFGTVLKPSMDSRGGDQSRSVYDVLLVGGRRLVSTVSHACGDWCGLRRAGDVTTAQELFTRRRPDCLVTDETVEWEKLSASPAPVVLVASDEADAAAALDGSVTAVVRWSDPDHQALVAARVRAAADRHRTETSHERDREWLDTVLRHSTDSMSVLDREGCAIYNTPAVEDQLGYDREELRGQSLLEHVHPEDREETRETFSWAVDQPDGTYATATYRRRHADGSWRWIEAVANAQFDNPAVGGLIVNRRDVTERERHRQRLREQEAYVGSLLDAQPDVFYVVDEDGQLREWNTRLASVLGYDDGELDELDVARAVAPDDRQTVRDSIGRVRRERQRVQCEVDLQTADGELIRYRLSGAPLTDGDDNVTGVVGTGQDISDRLRREQRLSVLNRVLRHNVRNRANVVAGRARGLRERLDGEAADHATEIERVGAQLDRLGRLARTVDEALDDGAEPSPVALDDAVRDAVGRLLDDGHHGTQLAVDRAEAADLRVADPPAVRVSALDPLASALNELLDNAVRHNDADEPRVRVWFERDESRIEIVVADNCPRIPPGEIEALGRSESELEHGGGLGLWFVEWIVSASGGELSFGESDLGGNRVRVALSVVND